MKSSETDFAVIDMYPGNVFNVTIKSGVEVTLETAKRLIRITNEMLDERTQFRGGIYDISKIAYIHSDAREYLAEGEEIKGTVAGVAILANTFLGKTVGNLFISLGAPRKFPVKCFDSPIRAEHWVRQQLKNAQAKERQNLKQVA